MNALLPAFAAMFAALATTDAGAVKAGAVRSKTIDMVVIHSTGGPRCDEKTGQPVWVRAGTLRDNIRTIEAHPKLGIHYMIDRDGTRLASVPEQELAHHVLGHSGRSIAVELVNDGDGHDTFPEPQLAALVALLKDIARRRNIGPEGIKRHSDLDTGRMPCAPERRRKLDPGDAFPLEKVLHRVYAPSEAAAPPNHSIEPAVDGRPWPAARLGR